MGRSVDFNTPAVYRIRLREHLGMDGSQWFAGLEVTQETDGCLLVGRIADQAALHGWIRKIRDLGLTLVSLERMETE